MMTATLPPLSDKPRPSAPNAAASGSLPECVLTVEALCRELQHRDIQLRVVKQKLIVDAPQGQLTDTLRRLLQSHKGELLARYAAPATDGPVIPDHPVAPPQRAAYQAATPRLRASTYDYPAPRLTLATAQTIKELGTAWLLPYRTLIEGAQQGLLPCVPVQTPRRLIRDPPQEVIAAAGAVARLAAALRGRAPLPHEKAQLMAHFATLQEIEQWRTSIECYL